MDSKNIVYFIAISLCAVCTCQPVEEFRSEGQENPYNTRTLWKRLFNPYPLGGISDSDVRNIRNKRSLAEECEKLELCMLHARSAHSFFAAYELYFVNKENARLWDHRVHSRADCERRFSCYE